MTLAPMVTPARADILDESYPMLNATRARTCRRALAAARRNRSPNSGDVDAGIAYEIDAPAPGGASQRMTGKP